MSTLYTPYIDVTINADWSQWQKYPNGRPNPIYYEQAIQWGIDGLIFGFITLDEVTKTPCWAATKEMPLSWALPLAQELNSAGIAVIISFGGASNQDISTHFSITELEEIYVSTIDMYQAKGLDFDLENTYFDAAKIFAALKNVAIRKPDVAISLTLPTLPTGLNPGPTGEEIILEAKKAGLNFTVNGMAMDYGDPDNDPDTQTEMGKAAVQAALSISRQLGVLYPDLSQAQLLAKVAITPMIGLNDDNSMFKLDDVNTLTQFSNINPLKFIGIWSFNRDHPSGYIYVDLTTSSNPEQKLDGEYSRQFVAGLKTTTVPHVPGPFGRAYFEQHPARRNPRFRCPTSTK